MKKFKVLEEEAAMKKWIIVFVTVIVFAMMGCSFDGSVEPIPSLNPAQTDSPSSPTQEVPPTVINPNVTPTPIVEENRPVENPELTPPEEEGNKEEEDSSSLIPTPSLPDDTESDITPSEGETEAPSASPSPAVTVPTTSPEASIPTPTPLITYDEIIGDRCHFVINVVPEGAGLARCGDFDVEEHVDYTLDYGTRVIADAWPNDGWEFDHWELDGIYYENYYYTNVFGCKNVVELTLDGPKEFNAVFKRVGAAPTPTPVPNIIAEYKLGDNVTGTLYDNMNYVISGTGATYDYNYNMPHNTWDEIGKYKLDVQKVVVEEGVTEIGEMALAFFRNCREIVLPSTLTKIGDSAFESCGEKGYWLGGRGKHEYAASPQDEWYMKINLEDTKVTEIGKRAFCGCTLEKLIFPETLEIMRDECFIFTQFACNDVGAWDDIVIPASVRQAGNFCFMNIYSIVVKGKTSLDEFELVTDASPEYVAGVGGYTPFLDITKLQFEP